MVFVIVFLYLGLITFIYNKYFNQCPIKIKILYPIICVFGIFLIFGIKGKINDTRFYNNKINSLIINSNNWQIRTTEFYLENGLVIYSLLNKLDLQIGDSIVKLPKTYIYEVYRKDFNGAYIFNGKCNYNQ
jgi:hypothetical protein